MNKLETVLFVIAGIILILFTYYFWGNNGFFLILGVIWSVMIFIRRSIG